VIQKAKSLISIRLSGKAGQNITIKKVTPLVEIKNITHELLEKII
jgi:hypothetical protein